MESIEILKFISRQYLLNLERNGYQANDEYSLLNLAMSFWRENICSAHKLQWLADDLSSKRYFRKMNLTVYVYRGIPNCFPPSLSHSPLSRLKYANTLFLISRYGKRLLKLLCNIIYYFRRNKRSSLLFVIYKYI